ncbi:MAG: bifunctional 4-hydroxy-2-oxoglutarate aldolase/2-dehydro-3-deoxy-phosphogluconate aldolase [Verrucomicrobiota bacterium]
MHKEEIINRLLDPGVIAIIRANDSNQLTDACQALIEGGIHAIEVTMTTPNALGVIQETTNYFGKQILMGVGSVLDDTTARMALLAGAEYVVTPVFRPEIISICQRYGKPICCGAYTPTEALNAHESGADFIKIFPADGLGPSYIKAVKAPLPQLRIIPTGGVTPETCGAFIKAGCSAVAAGSSLVSKDILEKKDWSQLKQSAQIFVDAMKKARNSSPEL